MRPIRVVRSALLVVPVLCAAACAGSAAAESATEPAAEQVIVKAPPSRTPATTEPRMPAAVAEPAEGWEPWPPAGATNEARPAPSGPMVDLTCPPGGMKVLDLLRLLSERTGAVVLYDEVSNAKMKAGAVTWTGDWKVPASRLPDACRSALIQVNFVLAPTGLGADGTPGYVLYDMNNPAVKLHPVVLRESEVLAHADCDGLYVTTTLRVRDMVDASRLRQMLSGISTQSAALGRVMEAGGTRTMLVADFAPVVAAMKRIVDEANRNAVPPTTPVAPGR